MLFRSYRAKALASNMCSKVLNGHIILTDTSITTILAPEMTYTCLLYTSEEFERPVGDHLVGVHVGRCAGAALHHVDDEIGRASCRERVLRFIHLSTSVQMWFTVSWSAMRGR